MTFENSLAMKNQENLCEEDDIRTNPAIFNVIEAPKDWRIIEVPLLGCFDQKACDLDMAEGSFKSV